MATFEEDRPSVVIVLLGPASRSARLDSPGCSRKAGEVQRGGAAIGPRRGSKPTLDEHITTTERKISKEEVMARTGYAPRSAP
jgi:hypothetical protein